MVKRNKNRKKEQDEEEEDNTYQSGNKIKSNESSDEDSIDKTERKYNKNKELRENPNNKKKIDNSCLEGKSEDELLKALFGVEDFDSSKNKSHVESDMSGVFKGSQRKRKYRQYMNRSGGHNKGDD